MPHVITVEPMTAALRNAFQLATHPGRLAVVLSTSIGNAELIMLATNDYDDAYGTARRMAEVHGDATVVTASSYRPTVVGTDLMPAILANPDYAPLDPDTPHLLGTFSRHCPDCATWLLCNDGDAQWITGRVLERDERGTLTVRGVRVLHTIRASQLGPVAPVAVIGDLVMWHPYSHCWNVTPQGLRPGAITETT